MENEFDNVMRKRTDADLFKILNGPPDDYQPAAMDAARIEFKRRNLSETAIVSIKQEIKREELIEAAELETNSKMPLDAFSKISALLFPFRGFWMASFYESAGYHTQANDYKKWRLSGIGFYALLFLLTYLYNKLTK